MIRIVIGNQGSGKSCYAICEAVKYMKKGFPVFSNLPVKNCFQFSKDDLMEYEFPQNAVIVFDEGATYGLGSRGNMYKQNTTDKLVEFFTMHRHYLVKDVIVVSPNFQDILPCVRDNAVEIVLVRCGLLGIFGLPNYKKIGRAYDISRQTGLGQLAFNYFWIPFSLRWFRRSKSYTYFDTYVRKQLKQKQWLKYNVLDVKKSFSINDFLSSFIKSFKAFLNSKKGFVRKIKK